VVFRDNQPYRREVIYNGPESNYEDVAVQVYGEVEIDDPDYGASDGWRIRLPITGKQVNVFADDLKPYPDAPETLQERTDRLLSFYHPMTAGFFVEALLRYADQVLEDEEETRKQMCSGLVGGDAWIEAAKAVREVFDDRAKAKQAA
jgi:hypothetical protein